MERHKIFICDDEKSIVDILTLVFDNMTDFEVFSEIESPQAYDRLVAEQVDVLIVDLSMPQMNGDTLIRRIRKGGELNGLHIICLSAERDGQEVAMAAGADVFVAKPFDLDELLVAASRGRRAS